MSHILEITVKIIFFLASISALSFVMTLLMTGGTGEDKLARERFRERNQRIIGEGHMLLSRCHFGGADTNDVDAYVYRLDKEIARTEKRVGRYQRDSIMSSFLRDIECDLRSFESMRAKFRREVTGL